MVPIVPVCGSGIYLLDGDGMPQRSAYAAFVSPSPGPDSLGCTVAYRMMVIGSASPLEIAVGSSPSLPSQDA